MKSNIKAFWPAFVVAILIALFSTVLPAQGGFPTTSPSALPAASFFVVQQVSGNSTGVRVDSLLAASADGNGIYSSSAAVPNGRIASNAAGDLVFNVPFQGANPYTGFFRTDVSGSSYAGLSETLSGQTSHFGFYDSSNSAAFFKSNVDGSHMHYFNGVANQSDLIFSATGAVFTQTGGLGGIKYNADYSAAYSDRSLIDRGFLNSRAPAQPYGRIAYGTGTGLTGEANLFYSPVLDYLRLGSNISAVGADSSAIGLFLSGNGKRIYFGDNGTGVPSSYGNAWLGEKGKTDSDALELHGASGIYFTGSGYNSDTDSTSVFMHIASEHSFNTSAVANKIRFPKYGSARNDYSVADPASIYYPDQWGWLRRTLSDSIKVTNPITNSGLVTLRTALRSLNDMIAEPANQILYGTGSGIGSSSSFTYDAVNGDLGITLNDNEQSFYITPVNNGVVTGYDNNNTGAFWYIENIEDDMLLSIHSSGEPEIKLDVNQDTSSIVLLSGSGSNSVEIFTSNLDETRISAIKNFPNGNKASILFPNPDSIVSDFYYNLPSKSGTIAMLDDIATDIDNNRIVRGTGSGIEGDTSLSFINTAHEIGGTIINRGIHVFDSSISGKAVFGTDENGLAVVLDAITESVIKGFNRTDWN